MFTGNPVLLALSFATLHELAQGHIVMRLAPGSPLVLVPQGVRFAKPLTRLREHCDVIPRLIGGEAVSYEGEVVELHDVRIEDLLCRDGAAAARARVPLYLAATGPRAVEPHEDARRARDAARRFVAVYLSMFPNVARETGLDARYLKDLRGAFAADGVDGAAPLVGDDVVDTLTAAGTVDDCLRRIEEYRDAGVELPILSPVDGALDLTIDRLH